MSTSSSSIACFQNVIFLYRSGVPAPSSSRLRALAGERLLQLFSYRPAASTPGPAAVVRDRSGPHSQRQTIHPLCHHFPNPVARPCRIASVQKAGRQRPSKVQTAIGLAQQQPTRI
jgi:hypothetical protein